MSFSEEVREIIKKNDKDLNGRNSLRATVELLGTKIVEHIAGDVPFKRVYDDVVDWTIGDGKNSIGVKITPVNEELGAKTKYSMNRMISKCLAADVSLAVITNGIEVVIAPEHLYYANGIKFLSTIDEQDTEDSLMSKFVGGKYNEEEFLEYYKYSVNTDSIVDLLDLANAELNGRIEEAKELIKRLRLGGSGTGIGVIEINGQAKGSKETSEDEEEASDDGESHTENEEESAFEEDEALDGAFDDSSVDEVGTVHDEAVAEENSDEEAGAVEEKSNEEENRDEEAGAVEDAEEPVAEETSDDGADETSEETSEETSDEEEDSSSDVEHIEDMLDAVYDEDTEYREMELDSYKENFEAGMEVDSINAMKYNGRKPFILDKGMSLSEQTAECIDGLLSLVHISKDANLANSDFARHVKVARIGFEPVEGCSRIITTPYFIAEDISIADAFDIITKAAKALEIDTAKLVFTVHITKDYANCVTVPEIVKGDGENEIGFSEKLEVVSVDKDILRRIPAKKYCVECLEAMVKRVISIKFGSLTDRMIENQKDKAQSIWDIIVNSQGGEANAVLPKRPFKIFGSNKRIISDAVTEVREEHEVLEINGMDVFVSHLNDFEYLFAIATIVNEIIGKTDEVVKINTEIDGGLLKAIREFENTDAKEALLLRRIAGYFTDLEANMN